MDNNKKFSYKQLILTGLLTAGLATGATYFFMEQQASSLPTTQLAEVDRVFNIIRQNYVGDVDDEALINGALTGMTDAIGDPYSNFLTGISKENLDDTLNGSFEGIGATMSMSNNTPFVVEPPIPGSPAEKEGLKVNDRIIKVDGKEIEGKTLTETVGLIRGDKGTKVTLTVQRDDDLLDITFTRDTIPIQSVFTEIVADHPEAAIIRVSSFNGNTAEEFKEAVESVRKDGAKRFLIDLRDNPGGSLDQVSIMSSMFLKNGQTIFQVEDGESNNESVKASKDLDSGLKISEPTMVLVNENSASASEIFAAALKENKRADILGSTTFGKGTMQAVKPLTEDTELKLTINKWLTPNGNWVNEKGLKPTTEIKTPAYYNVKVMKKDNSMQLGATGESVISLNTMLNALGYKVEAETESFTAATQKSVEEFQKNQKLNVTGIVDSQTASKIEEVLYQYIQKNDEVKRSAIDLLLK